MAEKSSLLGVRIRIETKKAKAALGVLKKFGKDPLVVGQLPGFPSIPRPSIPIPIPSGFPSPGTFPTGAFPLTPTTLGGLGASGCELLTGVARDICLLGLRFLPGQTSTGAGDCPAGTIKVGTNCVDLTALPPGGDPAMFPAGPGTAVAPTVGTDVATVGAFGLPALAPSGVSRLVRKCNRGMVLGIDNLCYPKAVLTGRSKFRKWRRPVRPPVTRRDVVAIRRSAAARDRVLELAKDVGLAVSKSKSKRKPKAHGHHHDHK